MKDRLYLGLAIGVGACLIVVGGWYIYNSKFSDTAKLENCADNYFVKYNMHTLHSGEAKYLSKRDQKKRKKQIKWKSLKYKLVISGYRIAFEKQCGWELKKTPHTFRATY